ncbi:MAG: hypothetical protein DRO12_06645 [Thermoprotei archaeon]|nr:MAG: hypothetical protein DRO12_06645 [Thermoprotei archaeon]
MNHPTETYNDLGWGTVSPSPSSISKNTNSSLRDIRCSKRFSGEISPPNELLENSNCDWS